MPSNTHPTQLPQASRRRSMAALLAAGAALAGLEPSRAQSTPAGPGARWMRRIPSSGEMIPAVGLGSWITFNVGDDAVARANCTQVVKAFFEGGGRMVDSSPMYGSSQPVIGHALKALSHPAQLFSAEKVWIGDPARGVAQMEASRAFWGVPRFDLMQVHNLLAWQEHLPRLFDWKAAGRLRYVGISTSEGRRHDELEKIMRSDPIDFVQLSYNLVDREAEKRLLPLAQERGMAVIVNRPFRQGALLQQLRPRALPGWAAAAGCDSWAHVALKFVLSHPAVTCAIPATSQLAHVRQNLGAAMGPVPDVAMRARMAAEGAAL